MNLSGNVVQCQMPQVRTAETPLAASPDGGEAGWTELRPKQGWQLLNLPELWRFRDLLFFLTWRDVKIRYKQTIFGAAWAVLQPAMMMVVFTIFFSRLSNLHGGDVPYPVFTYAGLLLWIFFATAMTNAGNSVVGSERLITKVYFPRLLIPLAAVTASVVDFGCAFVLLVILMGCYGIFPGVSLLLVPVLLVLVYLLAAGLGTLLAALNVAYRDVRYILPFLVQVWMFATPSIYMDLNAPALQNASPLVQGLLYLNPMTGFVASFRGATLGGPIPWGMLCISTGTVCVLFFTGLFYFRRLEDGFADII